ncbi:Magnesium and cobalt efflux protein CorC [Actinokineospora spheciospongiae]|uniref:Magnesium and cobalt efflux protein CorC n=1 Tax=Actinokineospora spheciospongiae TaxID=909613 RepID=W7IXW8_9PSEU|nr:hemolysin family protein [Actinokineospora spheciospongiae]EWC58894.1 Magnesium and cobalt efflux protein CorC [Actinokineospora spheciospongiae]PWW56078.1 CBS domain containing-hemolysin-like protein [Actinokineospora spheciospongiae]
MSSDSAGLLVLAVLLVLAAGCFAAADASLSAVSKARVEGLLRAGRTGARQLLAVVSERPRHINLLLLLRLGCELTATVLVTVVCLRSIGPGWVAVLVAGVAMVVVSYVLVGVGPRTIGRQHPYGVGLIAAGPVRVLGSVLGPLSRLLILVGNAITPGRGFREGPFSSEVELRELVDLAQERGVVDADEREMIHSVFELRGTIAREVMVPRTEMVWIEQGKSVRQALALSLRTGYTRIPVIGESVDDIVGLVNLKELVRTAMESAAESQQVARVMSAAVFVPDTKRLDDLLREMQLSKYHMAIAVDEYGGTAGLLTIEDILEEIVGEITDESDADERPPVEHLDDGAVRVSSRLPVEDLGALFGLELDDQDVETVGGLLAQRLGRVPLPGAEAEIAGLRFRAEGGKDNRGRMRITSVVVRPTETVEARDDRAGADDQEWERSGERG